MEILRIQKSFQDDYLGYQPEAVYSNEETVEFVHRLLESLSDEQRMCILMYHLEGQTIREIAEVLGCSESTVKSRLNYGRNNLRKACEDLQRQGYQLYSVAPIPFLLWSLGQEASVYGAAGVASSVIGAGAVSSSVIGAGAVGNEMTLQEIIDGYENLVSSKGGDPRTIEKKEYKLIDAGQDGHKEIYVRLFFRENEYLTYQLDIIMTYLNDQLLITLCAEHPSYNPENFWIDEVGNVRTMVYGAIPDSGSYEVGVWFENYKIDGEYYYRPQYLDAEWNYVDEPQMDSAVHLVEKLEAHGSKIVNQAEIDEIVKGRCNQIVNDWTKESSHEDDWMMLEDVGYTSF